MHGTDLLTGSTAASFLIGIFTILLIYWYSIRNHDYWKKIGIPYAKPYPFIGSSTQVFKLPFHDIELQRYKALGRIFGHFEGNRYLLSVAEPALLRDILVKDFHVFTNKRQIVTGCEVFDKMLSVVQGEDWKRIRTIVSPTFSTGKLKKMLSIFKECSLTLVENFKKAAEEDKPINAKRVYGAFTMDIIASSAFSVKLDSHNDPENKFAQMAGTFFSGGFNTRIIAFSMFPKLMSFLKISVFPPKAMDFFSEVTLQIIEERKRTGQVRNDFLQLLMETTEELAHKHELDKAEKVSGDITSNYGEEDAGHQIFKNVTSKKLSTNEMVSQCVAFFLAGYDTTATTLSLASYLLAVHPEKQEKLRAEIDNVLKENKGELTYEAVRDMKYLDNVISETLRLYPPSLRTERVAETEYKLGDTGLIIPKGMIITVPIYAMHRDPEFFPDPETFEPDRFSVEERAKRNQYVYLPFGAGPRNCVAMRFALLEIKVCLSYVISNFIIKRCPQTQVPLEFRKGQVLMQPKEISLEIEVRKDYRLTK